YQSLDHEPVRLLFLLIGKDSLVGAHIKLLSRISRLMNKEDLRSKLLQAGTAAEILQILKDEEMNYLDV
ncbi:MAG: PTS sugar transporter subunit IIA, partial [Bacteroidota bacterium]|nr:PTS sugar transporter subunit IIA [Bacteroidota bacterium]